MRVAILQSESRFIGGVERVTEGLLRSGSSANVDWHAVFLRPGLLTARVADFVRQDRMRVLDAGRIRNIPRTAITIAQVARQLRRWKIDAVISQGFHAQCYGGWAARLAGARNLFWCHNLVRDDHEGRDPVVRMALRAPTDAVISAPRSNLPNLDRYFSKRCPARLIYPAHPLDSFTKGNGTRIRREFGIPPNAPVAAIVGRLQPWKGQDVFVRAAAQVAREVPDARFLVIGGPAMPGDKTYESELKRSAQTLGCAEKVVFTGERHDVPDLITAADVVVHASVEPEPFGLVIIEAMAAGRAVIASNAGGPAEIIEEGECGLLVTPGDTAGLAAAMVRVFSDHDLRGRLQRGGLDRVQSRFGFQRMTADLRSVLDEVMLGRRSAPEDLPAQLSRYAE